MLLRNRVLICVYMGTNEKDNIPFVNTNNWMHLWNNTCYNSYPWQLGLCINI